MGVFKYVLNLVQLTCIFTLLLMNSDCFMRIFIVQGMYVLCNVASGKDFHKEAVMQQLLPQPSHNDSQSIMVTILQSDVAQLRTAAVWTIVNLTIATGAGALARVVKLRNAGIVSQLKNMVNDPCLDVKVSFFTLFHIELRIIIHVADESIK